MNELSRTVVLFGGASGERRVSVASAQHVATVLDAPTNWFVAPDGRVFDCTLDELASHARPFEHDFAPARGPVFASLHAALDAEPADSDRVFFLAFHGGEGEDGSVQRRLEARGLAFTGSGSEASARAFDKGIAKRIASDQGVRTAPVVMLPRGDRAAVRDALAGLVREHGRAVAKPVADGSSVGLFHLREANDVDTVADALAAPGIAYMAEAFIDGRELTVGVVDDGTAEGRRALPISEVQIAPGRAFDFEGKYLGKGTVEITPADLDEATARAAATLAVTVHGALGCVGYSRTDVIVDARGPVFLETNTLPGLTRASFLPQQLAAEKTSMRAFLEGQLALGRRRRG